MTPDEYRELCELREYKRTREADRLDRAFIVLESLSKSGHDPIISRRAFYAIVEALFALREETRK